MSNKLLFLSALGTLSSPMIASNHTNFVIINLDDVGYGDFSFNGAYGYQTPNIDRMAAEGIRFTHFLAAQPISGASRAGLLTGCYPNRIGFSGAPGPNSDYGIHPDEMTIAELLKQKDYKTAIYGKWHLGDAFPFMPLQNGFDDLRRDPGERYDVLTQYPEVTDKLMKIADAMRVELGDNLTRKRGNKRREAGLAKDFK